jgi:beta-glucosidase
MTVTATSVQDSALDLTAFPGEFAWGAATSAYQIEGGAATDGRAPSIWDTYSHTPGRTARGDTGDIACDHYHRWERDVELIGELGLGAYRMSLSWSRLQPDGRGALNPRGLDFYRRLLAGLRDQGVRTFVTLYHWDMPQSLEDAGGWPVRDTAGHFADYARLVLRELGDFADDWMTINEPWCSAFLGYGTGEHAPGRKDLRAAVAAAHHLNLAHGLAAQAIRAERTVRVGVAHLITDLVPGSSGDEDLAALRRTDINNNLMFLDTQLRGGYPAGALELYAVQGLPELIRDGDEAVIAAPVDFLGVNHYQQLVVTADPSDPHLGAMSAAAEPQATALRWSVLPDSLRRVLTRIGERYPGLPLYVTENGAAFDDHVDHTGAVRDPERVSYLRGYLQAAAAAIREGVNLQGYFVWSVMDNFEWAEGYGKRFGLIYIDYHTQARIPKASAAWYRDIIAHHARAVGENRRA